MKKLYFLILGLLLSNSIQSQDYAPLLIDSTYTWSLGYDQFGEAIIGESWTGYSYDWNDSLLQTRGKKWRNNYSYELDTLFLLTESLENNDTWEEYSRTTSVFNDGNIISKLIEFYQNNAWEKSSLQSYFYKSSGLDTLYIYQSWSNGGWSNYYKKEKTFDSNGNKTEQAEYLADSNDNFFYTAGRQYEYDTANRLIQEIVLDNLDNGNYFTTRTSWIYGNDNLLDTLMRCNYEYPNNGICNDVSMYLYEYPEQDIIIENRFSWNDDAWRQFGKEETFKGPGIYSAKPDSVITYYYIPDSLEILPTNRQHLQYQDLGYGTIYFKEESYNYSRANEEWWLTRLTEEWYRLKSPTNTDSCDPNYFSTFPNPCRMGEHLTLESNLLGQQGLEVLVFDMQGHWISTHVLTNQASIKAPAHEGIYTLMLKENGKLIGVTKQIVIE